MKQIISIASLAGLMAQAVFGAEPALTIYNQDFAVVRDTVPLDLKSGVNNVRYADATARVEPDSVILRDPGGKHSLQIWEQNYRNDPVTQELLLSLFEGKTIDFQNLRLKDNTQSRELIPGKIIRSGYVPGGGSEQPIIEVNGKLQFSLPGEPRFPDLGDDTVLKPTLNWLLQSDQPGKFDAEVSYITGGFTWEADYNLVSPEKGDTVDLIGWVTMNNHSGKTFRDAKIKLMAGDVNKIQPAIVLNGVMRMKAMNMAEEGGGTVTEKAFDEFHLYSLARPTTLLDRETKKVRVMREFVNAETNHLGIALPKGKLRFYRRDADGQMEFVGEDMIDHTPRNETIRVTTGNAFDLVGERKQTNFRVDTSDKWLDETFEIKLRNRKKEPVEIRVVEHLYRWSNWEIMQKSDDFKKTDSQTIEFRMPVKPDEERTVTYTVHYSW